MTRPVAWSFSALSDFKNCPFKYWSVKIGKTVSDANQWNMEGDDYHRAFEQYIARSVKLPDQIAHYQPVLDKIKRSPGQVMAEQQYCLDQNFNPCGYKDWDNAWVRGAADVTVLNGTVASVVDWKFGKPKKDPEQMKLLSALVFHHHPHIQTIKTAYVFVKHNKVEPFDFVRAQLPDLWNAFLPDVNKLVQAKVRDEWPKTPNPLCGWCPVASCQHNTNEKLRPPT